MDNLFMFGSAPFGEVIDHWVYSEAEFQRRLILTLQFATEYALKHGRPVTVLERSVQIVKLTYHNDLMIALHTEALRLLAILSKATDDAVKADIDLKLAENKRIQLDVKTEADAARFVLQLTEGNSQYDYMRKTQ